MNEPMHHHYVPVFYLSRWKGSDGCLCRFSRPYGRDVVAERVRPRGTAFEPHLYETRGLPPERAQAMEKDFMAKLDSDAAEALLFLETGRPKVDWTSTARHSWSRFLLAQMLRAPEDIAQLKSSVEQEWAKVMPTLSAVYAAERSPSDPPTPAEYIAQKNPAHGDELTFGIARALMSHKKVCELLSDMHWLVLEAPHEAFPLLTSDHPVWMTAAFTEEDAFLMIPIGPRRLFTATVKPETQCKLVATRRVALVKEVNKITVQHARKFVYGQTDRMLPFVQKHMSTKRHSTLLERLAQKRNHEIVAQGHPRADTRPRS